jgi:hypothetical protein
LSLFPEDRCEGLLADVSIVGAKLSELRLRRPKLRPAGRAEPHRLGFSLHAGNGVGNVAIPCATITLDQRERCTLSPVRGQGGH